MFMKSFFYTLLLSVSVFSGHTQDNSVLNGTAMKNHRDFSKEKLPAAIKPFLQHMKLVPGSRFVAGNHPGDSLQHQRMVTIASFYISSHEVTNLEYREFYYAKVQELGEEKARAFMPETRVENVPGAVSDFFNVKKYFLNPFFNDYPVTGVSWGQAEAYCKWYSEMFRKAIAADPKLEAKYTLPDFRLPTEMEWEYAARGGQTGRVFYPWGNALIGAVKGMLYPCNFGEIRDEMGLGIKAMSDDGAMYTSKAGAYPPNGYGLYDMAGNVNEWVMDVFRPFSDEPDDMNPLFLRDTLKSSRKPVFRDEKTKGDTSLQRVIRGGSFMDMPYYLVNAARRGQDATTGRVDTGFRIAMTLLETGGGAGR